MPSATRAVVSRLRPLASLTALATPKSTTADEMLGQLEPLATPSPGLAVYEGSEDGSENLRVNGAHLLLDVSVEHYPDSAPQASRQNGDTSMAARASTFDGPSPSPKAWGAPARIQPVPPATR